MFKRLLLAVLRLLQRFCDFMTSDRCSYAEVVFSVYACVLCFLAGVAWALLILPGLS